MDLNRQLIVERQLGNKEKKNVFVVVSSLGSRRGETGAREAELVGGANAAG